MSEGEIEIGDEVMCKPDGKLRCCKVINLKVNEGEVEYYPNHKTAWVNREEMTLKEKYKPDENTIVP